MSCCLFTVSSVISLFKDDKLFLIVFILSGGEATGPEAGGRSEGLDPVPAGTERGDH